MRKFGLILLAQFSTSPKLPDDDINTSVDQTKKLIAAIKKGLAYPACLDSRFSHSAVVSFLDQLAAVFDWEIYEEKRWVRRLSGVGMPLSFANGGRVPDSAIL